ncbi:MAG: class I SAM-dependent methyltransferase [Thermoleophilia bacterium]
MPDPRELFHTPVMWRLPHRISNVISWQQHLPFAALLVALHRPRTLVELGVHMGDSYCGFCQAVDELGLDTMCVGVDSWEGDEHAGHYGDRVLDDLRRHHDPRYGRFSRLVQSYFDDALAEFPDGSIDLLHIDGFHSYEAVRHDFTTWRPKLSERGIVLFHDTQVRLQDFGVWRFWAEVSEGRPSREFAYCNGLGVLAPGGPVPTDAQLLFDLEPDLWGDLYALLEALGERVVLTGKHQRIADLEEQLDAERGRLREAHGQINDLRGAVAAFTRVAGDAQSKLGELEWETTRQELEIDQLRDELRRHTAAVEAYSGSLSWRVTAPLRRLTGRVRSGSVGAPAAEAPAQAGARFPVAAKVPVDYLDWLERFPTLPDADLPAVTAAAASWTAPPSRW